MGVNKPLALRMRPKNLDEYIGQEHLLSENRPLRRALDKKRPHSMVFWGPPGTGKTTLAKLVAKASDAEFIELSAVLSGVKDIRKVVDRATTQGQLGRKTLLFVDEVHRFNKAQQDAFLPHIEQGTFIFIGATTENPSFELNNALLSRIRVYALKELTIVNLTELVWRALRCEQRGLGCELLQLDEETVEKIAIVADGDARRALNLLELINDLAEDGVEGRYCTPENIRMVLQQGPRRFDKKGEQFYDLISALHKTIRGSDPQAALYWLARLIDGGCDGIYLARRLVRIASEDIGNADPKALDVVLSCWDVQLRLGSPEGELSLAQCVVYLSCAPKSNAVYEAFKLAMQDVKSSGSLPVPLKLRNAPTRLMKDLSYGQGYRYAHDYPEGYVPNEHYFPDEKPSTIYYRPFDRGFEIKIRQKLDYLKHLDGEFSEC